MSVPETPAESSSAWTSLSSEEKRDRVLVIAGELFSREGIEFPMPELARAVGVGVGSLYRQLGKKEDVIAALVVDRLDALAQRYEDAAGTADHLGALHAVIEATVEECIHDRVTNLCWEYGEDRDDCNAARGRTRTALQHLIDSAREAGDIRPDATGNDLRYLFRSVREAERLGEGGGARLGELVFQGLLAR